MGEELELGDLFIRCDDGTYVPFEGIKPVNIICTDEMDEELYNSLPKEGTIELKFDMRRRDNRKVMKMLRRSMNAELRKVRHQRMIKEKARRKALKENGGAK